MNYYTAANTDAGIRKKRNQDSLIIMEAETEQGNILFASVCDGMGGLARGEEASAAMAHAFEEWFEKELPALAKEMAAGTFRRERLWEQWSALVDSAGRRIEAYGRDKHICLGTTAVGVLLFGEEYYTLNIGDSRAYLLSDNISLLTKDQTYVQQEMDAGRMTLEQSLTDPNRSVLLQCIGAGEGARPAFGWGKTQAGQVFLLCSDGFRHVVTQQELYRAFCPAEMTGEKVMKLRLASMTRLIKERKETDNISAILIRVENSGLMRA